MLTAKYLMMTSSLRINFLTKLSSNTDSFILRAQFEQYHVLICNRSHYFIYILS